MLRVPSLVEAEDAKKSIPFEVCNRLLLFTLPTVCVRRLFSFSRLPSQPNFIHYISILNRSFAVFTLTRESVPTLCGLPVCATSAFAVQALHISTADQAWVLHEEYGIRQGDRVMAQLENRIDTVSSTLLIDYSFI